MKTNYVETERTVEQEKAYQFLLGLENDAKAEHKSINNSRIPLIDNYKHKIDKAHLTKGNSKIGPIVNISTLCGDEDLYVINTKTGRPITKVAGTCCGLCDGCFGCCYAMKSLRQYWRGCGKSWGDNTILLREKKLFLSVYKQLKKQNAKYYKTHDPKDQKVKIFRINVSGEVENEEQFECWNALAILLPEIIFGVYTKNFVALNEFFAKHGQPEKNFVINLSQWHGVVDWFIKKYPQTQYPKWYNIFEYDDSNRVNCTFSEEDLVRLSKTKHCPAVDRHGNHIKKPNSDKTITCMDCRRCYTKTGATTAVYDH